MGDVKLNTSFIVKQPQSHYAFYCDVLAKIVTFQFELSYPCDVVM